MKALGVFLLLIGGVVVAANSDAIWSSSKFEADRALGFTSDQMAAASSSTQASLQERLDAADKAAADIGDKLAAKTKAADAYVAAESDILAAKVAEQSRPSLLSRIVHH